MGAAEKAISSAVPHVYQAIANVATKMAHEGIGKNNQNKQQGYRFRGIDDVYNALASVLAAEGLVILPRVLAREVTERKSNNGGTLFYVAVEVEYDFVSAKDGSRHTAKSFGEAMDSGDKATNKAMSAAYKYVCFQTFCIPTEGDNDADATTHQVAARQEDPPQPATITKEQVATVQSLLDEIGMSAKKFCEKYNLPNLLAMPANWYDKVVAKLDAAIQKSKQTEGAE